MSSSKALLAGLVLAAVLPAFAAEDLRALQVQGQRGQSLEQTRRDRYECHNWAVEQTGDAPPALTDDDERDDDKRALRRERVARAITGAAIGGAVGGILSNGQHHHHSSDHVLAGAAAGAAIGAATAGANERREERAAEEPSDYLRALSACLEGRGYSVSMPATT